MNEKIIYEYDLNDRFGYRTNINCAGYLLRKQYFEISAVNSKIKAFFLPLCFSLPWSYPSNNNGDNFENGRFKSKINVTKINYESRTHNLFL